MVAGGDHGLCASAAAHAARVKREFALRKFAREEKRRERKKQKENHKHSDFIKILENLNFVKLEPSQIKCVECHDYFGVVDSGENEFLYCKRCRSHLVELDSIKEVSSNHKNFKEIKFKSRKSKYSCTTCDNPLREYQYAQGLNLLIDYCEECRYIYLEHGEFERLILNT